MCKKLNAVFGLRHSVVAEQGREPHEGLRQPCPKPQQRSLTIIKTKSEI